MNQSIIDDRKWDQWAKELYHLQQAYQDIAKTCPLNREFENFDPATGFDLPLDHPWAMQKASWLLQTHAREQEKEKKV